MNLFALSRDATCRVSRLPLSKEVQVSIQSAFEEQEALFDSYATSAVAFDGNYKPDDDECLLISDFDDIDDVHGAIESPMGVPEINPDPEDFLNIRALFSGYIDGEKRVALIQSFDRRKIISASGLSIFHASRVYKRVEGAGMTLDTSLSAVLTDKSLRFFSFQAVRRIFDLSQYYVEASDADIGSFITEEPVHTEDASALLSICDNWIRRKFTLVKQSGILDSVSARQIKNSANAFNIAVQIRRIDGREVICLPEDKAELKKLLRFLDEDYYKSLLMSRNYLSNSKRRI